MKNYHLIFLLGIISFLACNNKQQVEILDEETWKLGWRMIESTWDENNELAELQFDSLLMEEKPMGDYFLMIGLQVKNDFGKQDEANEILNKQPTDIIETICKKNFAKDFEKCKNVDVPKEKVDNESLKMEIIKLFLDDQGVRGNLMMNIIDKYNLDSTQVVRDNSMGNQDEINRNRLKEIFAEHGFPTRKMIGKGAMRGIFFIIQHADGDKEWQKSQLVNIEAAIEKGDMSSKDYAYLYDRIQVNSGEKQRYGTQFAKVDRERGIAELRETEDVENLDDRRREFGMMPIDTYKRLILE